MKRLKKLNNSNGFTLIEIIVVLVILAVLAAVAIPAMLGMVDEARAKAYSSNARIGYTAAQMVVTEYVASGGEVVDDADTKGDKVKKSGASATAVFIVDTLAFGNMTSDVVWGEPGTSTTYAYFTGVQVTNNEVKSITYVINPDGRKQHTLKIEDSKMTVATSPAVTPSVG